MATTSVKATIKGNISTFHADEPKDSRIEALRQKDLLPASTIKQLTERLWANAWTALGQFADLTVAGNLNSTAETTSVKATMTSRLFGKSQPVKHDDATTDQTFTPKVPGHR